MSQPESAAFSILCELIVVMGVAALFRWFQDVRPSRLALTCVAATLVTHPLGWWALSAWPWETVPFSARIGAVECAVVAGEAVMYWRLGRLAPARAILISAMANAVSYLTGLLLFSS